MKKEESFIKRAFKGIGYSILAEVLCLFLVSILIVPISKLAILKIILLICTLIITLGLYFNWTYNAAKLDKDLVKFHGKEYDRYMPLKMALVGPIISYISIIILVLSMCGVIRDIFILFLWANVFVMPAVDAFTTEKTLEFLTIPGFLGILLLVLLQPATIVITYIVTYRDIDVVKHVFYKK